LLSKLKVGIAGFGVVGKRRRDCVNRHPNLELVAVCDREFAGKGRLENGVNFYSGYHDMLEIESFDILLVCLTNEIAPIVTIAGLNKGLHVFCEKPPGRNVEDIKSVRRVESENPNLKLMYGFNHRYHESVQDALQLVSSGELGKIINLRGVYGKAKLITFNQSDWRTRRSIAGGGVLLDQGIHMVDLIRLFGGEFIDFHSFISNEYWNYDVEDNVYALMKTKEGVVGMLHSSATQWRHSFRLEMNFDKGSVILSGILSGSKSYGSETMTVVWSNPDHDNGDPKETMTRYNNDPSWENEINIFTNSIISNEPVKNGSSLDALKTMEIVYKIYCADPVWCDKYNLGA
jgi:predicted dehydrogenase